MGYALTSKGQVTIPKHIREKLGVGPGDSVTFAANDRGEVVVQAEVDFMESFLLKLQRFRGSADAGLSTDEIMEMSRGEVVLDGRSSDCD
jgi:antitoxin PrlF